MGVPAVEKELPWDDVTRTVAQAVMEHQPDSTATEAYYYLVMNHLAHVLWQLGVGNLVLRDVRHEDEAVVAGERVSG